MPKKIQRFNVIDIEATCWENQITPDEKNMRDVSEIIEIGITQIDLKELKILDKKSYLIKPVVYPELSEYCVKLTGLTNNLLDKEGTTFEYAVARMMSEFKTMKYEWGSWGYYDKTHFEIECEKKGIQYPFHKTHINIKYLISMMTMNKVQRNVNGMLDFMHMIFEGNPHRGVDDSYNIAKMFIKILKLMRGTINFKISYRELGDDFYTGNNNN